MLRITIFAFCTLAVLAPAPAANASPNCMRDIKPYRLAGDTMEWSMKIAPGADCIQGLRWSTMQIYSVSVAQKPNSGELVLVGPGFRYFAKPDFQGTDTFTLVVVGKNRHTEGTSTVQITISRPGAPIVVSAVDN
ncbi:Ig-like domain-containing protein [Bradyrhizobium sp. B117]|uniref:Ig-like domain-containing protein n=1 Tax=Bradyrhizobium sp. B117 TaxID=3140246 RepID=UPI003183AFE2